MYILEKHRESDVNGPESRFQHDAKGKSWVRVDLGPVGDNPMAEMWANPCEICVIRSILLITMASHGLPGVMGQRPGRNGSFGFVEMVGVFNA